ncbi:metal-dependent hydrolase [Alkaliphilus pronyensis]|uniref:Alanine--tRNA ligase n=1 Tax=Alkaliphilus pronyensis TaxID=1482732 RepID=A0A6I0FKX9_9FIRM|nr:DHHA1 domain-containing protein [Alkaliphilus pronyensis]KAB3539068.1 metal-dependent hydrolase [Alkaliphilus pronyensis]
MTRKLFWEDQYLTSFTTDILSIEEDKENNGKYLIELAETAFYPEGGGQPNDEGEIASAYVDYVFETEGKIYHRVNSKPTEKNQVKCTVNWKRRHDFMQQHLGQHILSSVFYRRFNCNTVGFHLGKEAVTIDLPRDSFTLDELSLVEEEANNIIYLNLPVSALYPSDEELSSLPLRKVPAVEENIRLIEVKNVDCTPCGGTHLSHTGEVGVIKIIKLEKIRGIARVEFLCGLRAFRDYQLKNEAINSISNILSVPNAETFEAVERVYLENRSMNKRLNQLNKTLLDYEVNDYYNNADKIKDYSIIVKMFENKDMKHLQLLSSLINGYPKTIALLAAKNQKVQVVFTRSSDVNIDMNKLLKEVIPLIDGKGGGTSVTAQGGGVNGNNLEGLLQAAIMKLKHEYV